MDRKLAAILATDLVGYSRLMGVDEAGTLAALKAHRSELFDPLVARHKGRVVKLMGDGALIEFGSAVDAVECAIDIQRAMAERNGGVDEQHRLAYRMGINLGDIIVDGDDIYGDGVNVAARLETAADAGGICISGTIFDQIEGKIDLDFENLGPQPVKNIAKPVRMYRLEASAVAPPQANGAGGDERPSIAALPFNNMSGDPEQEYFTDGITEDIITDLSKVSGLFVIARNTTFAYKGKIGERAASRGRAGRSLCAGRQCAQGGQPRPCDRAANRWQIRRPCLGRPLRSRSAGHLRGAGRAHA